MREFFSLEGTFNKYAGFVADTIILSLLWLFFSLPFITIGASTTALFYVSTRRIANREGYISSDFWKAFKANFLRATVFWIAILLILFVLVWNMLLALENPEMMGGWILPAQMVILAEALFISTYIFPVTARFEMGVRETIKTCFFMANRHLLTSILCVGIIAGLVFIVLFFPQFAPLAFVAPGIYAMLSSVLIMRVFKKYRPEMDRDPVLELQEMEQKRAEEKRLAEIGKRVIMEEKSEEEFENEP